ncbi:MAG: flagellar biosynthetic protein FliR [Myxococcaceae bacterium]|nr:flagellar biosynthetic protein FliR [Myxococcaceae bacterium]MBH2005933.1 flagellar biosynthetic protein FliR [Myxococcaceae bacterium]
MPELLLLALIATRMMILVTWVPFLGSKNAPGSVQIGMAILLAILFWPLAVSQMQGELPSTWLPFTMLLLKEAFVGFVIGFVVTQIFDAAEMAGQIMDTVRGTNQIQLMVPELAERSSPLGDLNYQLALILFLACGLQEVFFDGLVESFYLLPVNRFPPFSSGIGPFFEEFTLLLGGVFQIAVSLSLPVVAVCLITNLAFGLINRMAPQINAYFLAMPATAVGGLSMMFLALFMTLRKLEADSVQLLEQFLKTIALLG